MCVDLDWWWEADTTDSSGQTDFALPIPDPEVWELRGGMVSAILGSVHFHGSFDTLELEQVIDPPSDTFVGLSFPEFLLIGANGDMLGRSFTLLAATCHLQDPPEPTTLCVDFNLIASQSGDYYEVVPGDDALLGALTLRYDFDPDWEIVPLSESYVFNVGGHVDLIYDRVIPEPNTGLLVMTGLLGLAYRQRRNRHAAHRVVR
jgi:hypothetical protein